MAYTSSIIRVRAELTVPDIIKTGKEDACAGVIGCRHGYQRKGVRARVCGLTFHLAVTDDCRRGQLRLDLSCRRLDYSCLLCQRSVSTVLLVQPMAGAVHMDVHVTGARGAWRWCWVSVARSCVRRRCV